MRRRVGFCRPLCAGTVSTRRMWRAPRSSPVSFSWLKNVIVIVLLAARVAISPWAPSTPISIWGRLVRLGGGDCICPVLQEWIAEKLRKESGVLKERRKAREERDLHQKKGGGNGGGGSGKQ